MNNKSILAAIKVQQKTCTCAKCGCSSEATCHKCDKCDKCCDCGA